MGQSVRGEVPSLEATPGTFGRASFAMMDILRRALGHALGAFGLGPDECPYRIVAFGPHWRLRDYGGDDRSLSLLVVATPIKRDAARSEQAPHPNGTTQRTKTMGR